MSGTRKEKDSMGEMKIPAAARWGASTKRAVENFPISGYRFNRRFIRAMGLIKQCAAEANAKFGTVPKDNPFVGRAGADPSVWSYGHRNPQGLTLHPVTGELFEHEHGPRGGDEINLIRKGANYGWPVITYGRQYYGPKNGEGTAKPDIEQPRHPWRPRR